MTEISALFLRIGDTISATQGDARGRIGLLAVDDPGHAVAVTARHTIHRGLSTIIGPRRRVVGTTLPMAPIATISSPACDALALFRIDTDTLVDAGLLGLPEARGAVRAYDRLGERVFKVVPEGEKVAVVHSVGGTMRLTNAGDPPAQLKGVVELRALSPDFAGEGDAGALIADADGRPMGLLLAERGGRYVAAPLREFLESNGLRIMTAQDAERHNQHAQERACNLDRLRGVLAPLARELTTLQGGPKASADIKTAARYLPSRQGATSDLVAHLDKLT